VIFSSILSGHSNHVKIQFIRYGFVAVVAFIVDFGLLFVFTHYCHIYYLVSAILSFSISLVPNYILSKMWVFQSGSAYKRHIEIIAFCVIGFVGLLLNILVIWLLTSIFGLYYLISKLLAVVVIYFWSFFARRYFIYNRIESISTK
jgi:putative flippase GtrA